MIPDIYNKLINALSQRSKEGNVNWRATSSANSFAVHFKGGFSFSITADYDQEAEQNEYKIAIHNKDGAAIDQFSVADSGKDKRIIEDLYETGRRKALKIDLAIETITNELSNGKPVGLDGTDAKRKKTAREEKTG